MTKTFGYIKTKDLKGFKSLIPGKIKNECLLYSEFNNFECFEIMTNFNNGISIHVNTYLIRNKIKIYKLNKIFKFKSKKLSNKLINLPISN